VIDISDEEFDKLIGWAMDKLPQQYIKGMTNVAVVYQDDPTPEQRQRLSLHPGQTLFGLYEGVALPQRQGNIGAYGPDKITIFKGPLTMACDTLPQLKAQVLHTLWHEIGHYYGLDHKRIHELEQKPRRPR